MDASETAALSALNQAPASVRAAIHAAGGRSPADFAYLVKTAAVESGFDAGAQATTSSAAGLYQFVEGTWLDMVERYGGQAGLGRHATALESGPVSDGLQQEILDLRHDPKVASLMASAYAAENRSRLEGELGREVTTVDQYLAHFLGPNGAVTFLKALANDPNAKANDLLPTAAQANRGVFYQNGEPRSLREVYAFFSNKFDESGDLPAAAGDTTTIEDAVGFGTVVTRPFTRADAPTFAANTSFMVNVLLGHLEQNSRSREDVTSQPNTFFHQEFASQKDTAFLGDRTT